MQSQIKQAIHQTAKTLCLHPLPFKQCFLPFPIYFAFAGWLCTQLRNFTLPLEKDSSALAGIRVQDDPTDVRACPVCATDEPLTWYCWLCVLHLFMFLAEVKTVGSIQSLFLHNSGLKLSEGARKWGLTMNCTLMTPRRTTAVLR